MYLQDAIKANSFYPTERKIEDGNVEVAFASAQHVIEGTSRVGGQDHFYLETQACIAIPKGEDGEMEILASTQGLSDTQKQAASALGVPANRILVKVKRIGMVILFISDCTIILL